MEFKVLISGFVVVCTVIILHGIWKPPYSIHREVAKLCETDLVAATWQTVFCDETELRNLIDKHRRLHVFQESSNNERIAMRVKDGELQIYSGKVAGYVVTPLN